MEDIKIFSKSLLPVFLRHLVHTRKVGMGPNWSENYLFNEKEEEKKIYIY